MKVWAGSSQSRWKGKGKAPAAVRDEGSGGSSGIVIPMTMVGTGVYDAGLSRASYVVSIISNVLAHDSYPSVYTIPVEIGSTGQNLSLQVDTGSSDLWVASTSCSSSACSSAKGHTYDPTNSQQTGKTFTIQYLEGTVSGPVVWDQVEVGGYTVSNQALAAATQVDNEPLSAQFNGILGLALPQNSIISTEITPTTSDAPDGSTFPSNLFGITPSSSAPPSRFVSLSLSRPGSNRTPSLLGIGRHPTELVSDPSKIKYSSLTVESPGPLFWKVDVRAITVYHGGQAMPINIGRSHTGAAYPAAVLDSGVPYILTTSWIADGIYGALGISPASDGQYYVPCSTPLNMTITLDGQSELPLHPLDLTAEPATDPSSTNCVGLIQTADAQIDAAYSDIGDMVLGVPFLRNMYTVLAYDVPNSQGKFPATSTTTSGTITPQVGLLCLTDPATAMAEFNTVRVLNQPLDQPSPNTANRATSDKKLSIGIDILIGLFSFFGLCLLLFGARWWIVRRKFQRAGPPVPDKGGVEGKEYQLARRDSNNGPSEDALRTLRFNAYKADRMHSYYSADTAFTRVGDDDGGKGDLEFGYRLHKQYDSGIPDAPDWDPHHSLSWRDTLVGDAVDIHPDLHRKSDSDPASPPARLHSRQFSDLSNPEISGVTAPLLAHTRDDSRIDDLAEFGVGEGSRNSIVSMAGVGTAARGSRIDPGFRHSTVSSTGSFISAVDIDRPESPSQRRPAALRASTQPPPRIIHNSHSSSPLRSSFSLPHHAPLQPSSSPTPYSQRTLPHTHSPSLSTSYQPPIPIASSSRYPTLSHTHQQQHSLSRPRTHSPPRSQPSLPEDDDVPTGFYPHLHI